VLIIGAFAIGALVLSVPGKPRADGAVRRPTDRRGLGMLAAGSILVVFYLSSRPITGVAPMRDWRLLLAALIAASLFVRRERRARHPFVPPQLFRYPNFTTAGVTAGLRMISMGTVAVVVPLLLRDLYERPASTAGLVLMVHAASLLLTMRMGGLLADRWSSQPLVVIGAAVQGIALVFLGLTGTRFALLLTGLVIHGLAAGVSLAPIHRAALSRIPTHHMGVATGLYSMMRFAGTMLGSTIAGVVLQIGFQMLPGPDQAYMAAFFFPAVFAAVGVVLALRLRA
jgi:predicted MFS family arabinose efflux permease